MSTAHTPGPWSFHEYLGGPHITECDNFTAHTVTIGADEKIIGEVVAYRHKEGHGSGHPRVSDFAENEANAHLISAAPELLEALQEAIEDSEEVLAIRITNFGENYRPERLKAMRAQITKARAAIAKATGSAT